MLIGDWAWGSATGTESGEEYRYRDQFWEGIATDIGIWLTDGASDEDISAVHDHLCVPVRFSSPECALIEGVRSVDTDYASRTIWLQMMPGTSEQRREEVAELFRAVQFVERVEVDVTVDFNRG